MIYQPLYDADLTFDFSPIREDEKYAFSYRFQFHFMTVELLLIIVLEDEIKWLQTLGSSEYKKYKLN